MNQKKSANTKIFKILKKIRLELFGLWTLQFDLLDLDVCQNMWTHKSVVIRVSSEQWCHIV